MPEIDVQESSSDLLKVRLTYGEVTADTNVTVLQFIAIVKGLASDAATMRLERISHDSDTNK